MIDTLKILKILISINNYMENIENMFIPTYTKSNLEYFKEINIDSIDNIDNLPKLNDIEKSDKNKSTKSNKNDKSNKLKKSDENIYKNNTDIIPLITNTNINTKTDININTKTDININTKTDINTNINKNNKSNIDVNILDPLSVIIKLAIISNKPIGTKLFIKNNVIHLQEPGIFQAFCRYIYKTNKEDLQYLYNPIQFACKNFLNNDYRKKNPKIVDLFICAQRGILQLIETYKNNSVIKLCLNYYHTLIENYVKERYISIFRDDEYTILYKLSLLIKLNEMWTSEKIKIVLDMICFLNDDVMANDNVKSLDIFIQNIDKNLQNILYSFDN